MTFAEVARIFEQLPAVRDDRYPPDGLRRGQFRAGWEDVTVRGKEYRPGTLQRLTWHNLGYRFGKVVGPRSAEQIGAVYEHLARLYDGTRPDGLASLPGEIADGSPLVEGAVCRVTVNAYERNREAVRQCKQHHGTVCVICGFDFGAVYGAKFAGFIHAHHRRAVSEAGGAYVVDPVADLCPVCPNCHAVIHHGGRLRGIEEVRQLLDEQRHAEPGAAADGGGT
jgi:5-methylcytosine-specific restriction protein A